MIELASKNESDARAECLKLSQDRPGEYIIPVACFGLFATVAKRLHTFAPSDAVFDWYALNGKLKPFTGSQKIADQNATPILS